MRFWAGTSAGFGTIQYSGEARTGRVLMDGFLPFDTELQTDEKTVVRFGDVSGDGFDDLVIARPGAATVWLNEKGAKWGAPLDVQRVPTGEPTKTLFKLGDVRGRGRLVLQRQGLPAVRATRRARPARRAANGQ